MTAQIMSADTPSLPATPPQPIPEKKEPPTTPNKPGKPAFINYIYASYDPKEMALSFSNLYDIEWMAVTIEDQTGFTYTATITFDNPELNICLENKSYYITCVTDTDITYAGEFFIF